MRDRSDPEPFGRLVEVLRERALRAVSGAGSPSDGGEGLRARKKRLTRQLISDTATALFLQRGFDKVRVSEVAEAAGVSEKTVFNYFPTKESLVLDREEAVAEQIRHALAEGAPVGAAVEVIAADVRALFEALREARVGAATAVGGFKAFVEMIEGTPELRAAQRDMADRLVQLAAETLAARAGVDPHDPEPQIAASAIVGLWRVQYQSMQRHVAAGADLRRAATAVIGDVRRAGRLIESGLWCFEAMVDGAAEREELRAAAESVEDAVRQVLSAIRQARSAWRRRAR